jgi:AcrR family transcriptional regulator
MGRPRQFDTEHALDQATDLFWEKGYADTSVSDLEEHLGVGRQSLYGAFGDKRELFVKTLDRYLDQQPANREILWTDDAGLAEIRVFFDGVVGFVSEGSGRSCFLVKSALSEGGEDVTGRCGRNQDHMVLSLANALRGAVGRGEIDAATDVDATAVFLVSQIFGLNVMARNGSSPETLRRTAEVALATLV